MATVTTVDVTTNEGYGILPLNTNDVMDLVETLATQNIKAVKSANRINDGAYEYVIENGKVVEEALIEKASAQAFDKTSFDFTAVDPTLHVKYFNNYEAKQFTTTIRRDDIRAILANKGEGVEEVVSNVLDTLTQGESKYDFEQIRNVLYNGNFIDYSTTCLGSKVPKSMKGVIWALRDMYNHLISDNSDLTGAEFESATPAEDVRIAVSPKLLNLIDVVELAHVFNLSKEELFGKIVVVDVDDLETHTNDYIAYVYDRKAVGRATRVYDYTQDVIGKGRYTNTYLTVERAYFHNDLFKSCKLDCSSACTTALGDLLQDAE